MRSSSTLFCGPRALSSAMSIGSISASFAITIAFSAVPPMPMPSMPGGHQPAPIVGTVFSTQSAIESDGLSIANIDFELAAGHELHLDDGRRVVPGVLSRAHGIGKDRGTQLVVGIQVGAAHALVD